MQKNIFITLAVIFVLIIALGGGYFLTSRKSSSVSAVPTPASQQDAVVPTLTPDQIGLSIVSSRAGKALMLNVTKISDINVIEYELTYTSTGDIPRGVIGHIDIKAGQGLVQQEIVLGTCSNVCHYDSGVGNIKLTLKVTKNDGKVYSLTDTAPNPQ
jgi:hypothetical protein